MSTENKEAPLTVSTTMDTSTTREGQADEEADEEADEQAEEGADEQGTAASDECEMVSINDDVYNMFFLSNLFGQGTFFFLYIFFLKMVLYVFLVVDAIDQPIPEQVDTKVYVAQFIMLPVAVSMQQDLIATYFLIGNIDFDRCLKQENPHANRTKFYVANLCRGIDGLSSLLVNFIILLKADAVLSLFLNFAALQFLQDIDNLALDMCASGYLTQRLEELANKVQKARLPKKQHRILNVMDSVLFLSTTAALCVAWGYVRFA